MANTQTTANQTVEVKTYYNRTLLSRLTPALVFDKFAQKKPVPKNNGKTVAIVSHGAAIRSFMCRCYEMELSEMKNIDWVSNASVTHIFYENGQYRFDFVSYDDFLGNMVENICWRNAVEYFGFCDKIEA